MEEVHRAGKRDSEDLSPGPVFILGLSEETTQQTAPHSYLGGDHGVSMVCKRDREAWSGGQSLVFRFPSHP